MTVSSTTSRVAYAGNGATVTFTVPFYFLASADLVVIRTASSGAQTTLVLNTDYAVTGAGVPAGGSITCTTAPASTDSLTIYRDPAVTQLTDYQPNDPFPAETHERALDKLTMLEQRSRDLVTRSFRLSDGDVSGASTTLPTPSANKVIAWNASGSGLQNVDPNTLATIVSYGSAYAELFSGTGAQTAFSLSVSPGAQSNLDVSVGGVTQRPGIDYVWISGITLTFTSAPPVGSNNILVRYTQALAQGTMDSGATTFVQAGTGAVTRTAQAKMRDVVSVKDFGAVGDGATNDTAAIQAAVNAAFSPTNSNYGSVTLVFPRGTYRITSAITLPNAPFRIAGEGMASVIDAIGCSAFLYPGQFSTISEMTDLFVQGNGTAGTEAFNSNPTNTAWVLSSAHFKRARVSGFPRLFNVPNAQLCSWEDCVFNVATGGSVFYVRPTANGQAANSNRVVRCQITGTDVQTVDYDRGGFSVNCANWVFDACDFQQSGTTVPVTIKDVDWRLLNCEFENQTAACCIDIVADDTQQPNSTVLDGNVLASAPTIAHVRVRRTGTVQFAYYTTLRNMSVSGGTLVSIVSGRSTLIENCAGTVTDAGEYTVQINGSANLGGGSFKGSLAMSQPAGSYALDDTAAVATVANGGTTNFTNASGLFLLQNTANGCLGLFLCAGGSVTLVASAGGTAYGTVTYSAGVPGYVHTNTVGSSQTFTYMWFRTRTSP